MAFLSTAVFLGFSSSTSQDNITSDCQLCMNVLFFIKFKRLISFLMTHFLLQDWIQICPDLISLGLLQSTSKNVSLLPSLLTGYCYTLAQYSYCLLKSLSLNSCCLAAAPNLCIIKTLAYKSDLFFAFLAFNSCVFAILYCTSVIVYESKAFRRFVYVLAFWQAVDILGTKMFPFAFTNNFAFHRSVSAAISRCFLNGLTNVTSAAGELVQKDWMRREKKWKNTAENS